MKRLTIGTPVDTTSGKGVLIARTTPFPDGVRRLVVMLARPMRIRRAGMIQIIGAVTMHSDNVWSAHKS